MRQIVKGRAGPEFTNHGLPWFCADGGVLAADDGDHAVSPSEILLPNDLRLAVDPSAFSGVVISR